MANDQIPGQPDPQQPQVVYVQAPKKPWYKKLGCMIPLGIVVLIIIAMSMSMGGSSDSSSDSSSGSSSSVDSAQAADTPAIPVTAVDLVSAYEANEIAADKEYKGKKLELTGTLKSVTETLGTYTVTLEGPEMSIADVWCKLQKSQVDAAAELVTGNVITVHGVGDGYDSLNAYAKDCTLN
ncbi:hypothetical protein [Corynebacterium sp. 13CS0277]|uniref:OB-fold protein n=1 Tax=Corynebacterium sp. 13CS0277 TaxID=2071994 RepID=UPI001304DE7B|nr:hypothetical protein [Corynebacterium sp. 13CS0277]